MCVKPWDFETDTLTCTFCGKTKKGISFSLAPVREIDWALHFINCKVSCPECYLAARMQYMNDRDVNMELEELKEQVKKDRKAYDRLK